MVLANIACLQTIEDDATAQRALDYFLANALGLDIEHLERMIAYRGAVKAGVYSDEVADEPA